MKLEIKIAAQDKAKMVETYRSSRSQVDFPAAQSIHTDVASTPSARSLPPLQHVDDDEGWTVIDKSLSYV